jgi:hypothetical protein
MPIDKGTTLPITQLSGLQINYQDANSCLNPPIVTTIERDKLINNSDPAQPIKDGTIIFNSTTNYQEYYSKDKGGWIHSDEGTGDVVGPPESVVDNIAVFADTTGKTIKDGGVTIEELQTDQKSASNTSLYQLSNLGALQFGSNANVADTGTILVDSLTPMTFQTQGTGVDSRVCTVINGEEGAGSSSPSALLEINSTEGGFLHARMTTAKRDILLDPKDGLEIYNTDTKNLNIRQNGAWIEIKSGGNGNVVGPSSAVNNNIPVFDGASGALIKDSGINSSQIVSKYLPFSTASFISTYDILKNDFFVVIYVASGGTTVNLPSLGISSNVNRLIIIKQAGVGSTTIKPNSPDSIQAPDQSSYVLSTNNFVWLVGNINRYWMPIGAG